MTLTFLQCMLSVCEEYMQSPMGSSSTLIRHNLYVSGRSLHLWYHDCISLDGVDLKFSDTVMHLGHLLSYNLDDTPDIIRVTKDLNRKANFILCTFKSADPFVKCFLIKAYCLSLYDCTLWSLSCKSLHLFKLL